MAEWLYVGGDSSEEQNAVDVPEHINIMAHDDESPARQMNFIQKQHRKLLRRSISRWKKDLKSCPGWRNTEWSLYIHGTVRAWQWLWKSNVTCRHLYVSDDACLHNGVLTTASEDVWQSDEANVAGVRVGNRVPGAVNKYWAQEIQQW